MGLSANRTANSLNAGGGEGQFSALGSTPQTNPALPPQPVQPQTNQITGQVPALGQPQHSPLPWTTQMPQVQPGQYTHLQNFAHSQNPLMAILSRSLMSGMENRRNAAGMTPEAWQAQIDANRATWRARRGF